MQFDQSIFIFRRDLRLEDNLALLRACELSERVIPIFIFDPRQLRPHPYLSSPGMQFLFSSLEELAQQIEASGSALHFFHGDPAELLPQIAGAFHAKAVFCSKDYTPFARRRDQQVEKALSSQGIAFHSLANLLLHEPESIRSQSGTPYTVFGFFAKACAKISPAPVSKLMPDRLFKVAPISTLPHFSVEEARKRYLTTPNDNLIVKGGRTEALSLLANVGSQANYNETRNFPALSATTHLSTHNKFGTISIREFFHAVSSQFDSTHTLCSELHWRDFFTHIAYNFPHVFEGSFNRRYDKVEWEENDEYLEAWQTGTTGFPIVDAGMRELNQTGFMHNRVRMIVASFLTKDLLLDWHHGERYFARKLLDYDPAVNNGNWQWAASTGCDAQPYFRIFNPWLQGEKFDKEAKYIKHWIPELVDVPAKRIHQLYKDGPKAGGYPAPIVRHDEQKTKAIRLFEAAKSGG